MSDAVEALEAEVAELRVRLDEAHRDASGPGFVSGLLRGLAVVVVVGLVALAGLFLLLRTFRMPGG